MSARSIQLTDKLYRYLISVSLRDDKLLRRLRRETERLPMGGMQISPEQGQFMGLLIELTGARKAIEIGTFTGYSSLAVARALPPDGRLICCDVSAVYTAIARKYWQAAGVADKVTLELGPALPTLERLIAKGEAGSFDFAFIDADKSNYRKYYERCLALVRPDSPQSRALTRLVITGSHFATRSSIVRRVETSGRGLRRQRWFSGSRDR